MMKRDTEGSPGGRRGDGEHWHRFSRLGGMGSVVRVANELRPIEEWCEPARKNARPGEVGKVVGYALEVGLLQVRHRGGVKSWYHAEDLTELWHDDALDEQGHGEAIAIGGGQERLRRHLDDVRQMLDNDHYDPGAYAALVQTEVLLVDTLRRWEREGELLEMAAPLRDSSIATAATEADLNAARLWCELSEAQRDGFVGWLRATEGAERWVNSARRAAEALAALPDLVRLAGEAPVASRPEQLPPVASAHLFELHRDEDETGISGTGVVAQGVVFASGKCALLWLTEHTSVGVYDSIEELTAIHGHDGRTRVVYVVAAGGPVEGAP